MPRSLSGIAPQNYSLNGLLSGLARLSWLLNKTLRVTQGGCCVHYSSAIIPLARGCEMVLLTANEREILREALNRSAGVFKDRKTRENENAAQIMNAPKWWVIMKRFDGPDTLSAAARLWRYNIDIIVSFHLSIQIRNAAA